MKNSFKIHFAIFLSAMLFLPFLAYAQDQDTENSPILVSSDASAAGSPASSPVPSTGTITPSAQGTQSETEKKENVPKNISVKLQVPLPFVAMGCTDENGSPTVCDLKDYIMGVYKLLIGVGALFAVVMMIIAGYQWIFSGGSSDEIGAAKNKIFSASVGLILALVSYVVLNSISPRLVSMTLPEIDSVQGIDFEMGETCQNSQRLISKETDGKKLSFLKDNSKEEPVEKEVAECGYKYYVLENWKKGDDIGEAQSKADDFCTGGYCDQNQTCLLGQCQDAIVYGDVKWNKMQFPPLRDYLTGVDLYRLCNRGFGISMDKLAEISFRNEPDVYKISQKDLHLVPFPFDENCGVGTYKGYALGVYVDDGIPIPGFTNVDNFFVLGANCKPFVNGGFWGDIGIRIIEEQALSGINLIKSQDLNTGFKCDLDLTGPEFRDYD